MNDREEIIIDKIKNIKKLKRYYINNQNYEKAAETRDIERKLLVKMNIMNKNFPFTHKVNKRKERIFFIKLNLKQF